MKRVRVTGTVTVEFLCDCAGRPHDVHSQTIEIDQAVHVDSPAEMKRKAIKDHFGKPRYREIAVHRWTIGPTFSDPF